MSNAAAEHFVKLIAVTFLTGEIFAVVNVLGSTSLTGESLHLAMCVLPIGG